MGSRGDRSSRRDAAAHAARRNELVLVGANHRTCSLDRREALLRQVTYSKLRRKGRFPPPWEDLVLLTTCNRIEAYATTTEPTAAIETIAAAFGSRADSDSLYVLRGLDAVAHLFRVASGLDSLAQGEAQVTAQVRAAASRRPTSLRRATPLADAFERAARAAPRIRSLAGLEAAEASASHAALRFLRTTVPLAEPTVALLGTGKMARIAAASLRGRARILVLNRDPRRARDVARDLGGRGLGLDNLDRVLATADVVLAATAAQKPIVSAGRLRRALARRDGRPLWLIDLGFPRNIDPAGRGIPGVTLADVDALAPWGGRPLPPAALAKAEARIREEATRLLASWESPATDDVAALRRTAEAIRRTEVDEALGRLPALTEADRAVVDKLASRLVNRFLHGPTERLRHLPADERTEIVRELRRGLEGNAR